MQLIPRLVVPDVRAVLPFYAAVFDAHPDHLFEMGGRVVHVDMQIDGVCTFALSDAAEDPAPTDRTSVLMEVGVEDADAVWERAMEAGAEVVYPLADQPYGARSGRFKDPAGHQWLVSHPLEDLTPEQTQARLDAM